MNINDIYHVLQCKQQSALDLWSKSIQDLERWMTINQRHPEMIELIILGLQYWHDQVRIPFTYDILEPTLRKAWNKQRRIGWRSFLDGFWVLEWRQCQSQYLRSIRSQKSSTLWISRAQRRIWLIAWNLWTHRNNHLHNEGKTIHSFEMTALHSEIRSEWETGIGQLSAIHDHLFTGQIAQRLDDTTRHKLMWLFSVWSARDNDIHIGPPRTRNNTMVILYNRWRSTNIRDE
jgi:hypothetical protein